MQKRSASFKLPPKIYEDWQHILFLRFASAALVSTGVKFPLGTTSCYLALKLSAVRCTICAQDVIVCLVLSA